MDPLYPFVFAGLFSPGPNIVLLTASGARFGLRATIPYILGVAIGVGIIAAVTALGLTAVLLAVPAIALTLRIASALWILWMAYRLLIAAATRAGDGHEHPFTFTKAVLFQWVNPKIWAVAIAASAGYASGLDPLPEAARLAMAFTGINLGVCLFWTWAGSLLSWLTHSPRAWRVFMTGMSLLLASSAAMVFV